MYKFVLENKNGNQLVFNELGGDFTIDEIQGLSPADATINTNQVAYIDGEIFNSAKVNMRTLEIAFAIENNAAANRIAVYKVVKPKHWIRAYYSSSVRNVYIDGYVQSVVVTHYEMKQICTVSILCPAPYWQAAQAIVNELTSVTSMFHFPFASTGNLYLESPIATEASEPISSEAEETLVQEQAVNVEYENELVFGVIEDVYSIAVENNGDVSTGLTFELYARDTVSNPKIFDYETGAFIGLNFTMQAGDLVTINTSSGEKSVSLLRNGVSSNLFNSLMKGITWLQLDFGGGVYTYEVGSGYARNLLVTIKHNELYEGV